MEKNRLMNTEQVDTAAHPTATVPSFCPPEGEEDQPQAASLPPAPASTTQGEYLILLLRFI